jgi:A/G-specific adenine glycosylase
VREKEVQFVGQLIDWFRYNQRTLPWRVNKNPYKVWVSEIMLQQTRVNAVISYFHRFIDRFPTVQSLAEASLEDIYQVWEGLGYYSRAKKMHEAAQIIQNQQGGIFPDTYEKVKALPGIGEYSAGAILSIAYNQPYAAVDGNVLRVFARIFRIKKNILDSKTKKEINALVTANISLASPSEYTESIMELGALVCLPKNPKCLVCPIQGSCLAFKHGEQEKIPIRVDKTIQIEEEMVVLVIRCYHTIWMEKRKDKGLLAGFWQIPNFLVDSSQNIVDQIKNFSHKNYFSKGEPQFLFQEKHIYSHRIWKMKVYEIIIESSPLQNSETSRWIPWDELQNFPIGGAFRKIIKKLSH